MVIDLNCDMGESFGAGLIGNDAELMPLVSSANIACGFHGGDPGTIHQTIRLAQQYKVAIGRILLTRTLPGLAEGKCS